MPDWAKKSFAELRDVSPEDVPIQWRFAREALGSPELGISRFTYEPGARMPWGHRHREQEEAYVVVAGSGRAKLDDEVVELRPGTCCASRRRSSARSRPVLTASTSSVSAAASPRAATPSGTPTSGDSVRQGGGRRDRQLAASVSRRPVSRSRGAKPSSRRALASLAQ